MTPPTPEQVAALEQWAREAKKWEMVRTDEWPELILALIICTLTDAHLDSEQAASAARDAALARAEQAEREARTNNAARVQMERERDAARAEAAALRPLLHEILDTFKVVWSHSQQGRDYTAKIVKALEAQR